MRSPNTVDFWRGFALLEIGVNHIPDNGLTRLTHASYSWSDCAELFVFLAGWAFARRIHGRDAGPRDMLAFTGARFAKICVGQIVTALLVVGFYIAAARWLGDATILADNHATSAVTAPGSFLAGLFMLSEQPRFIDILPLYAVLTLATPFIYFLSRRSTPLLLAVSGALFAISLLCRANLPTWPDPGRWFFDPLSWQAMFVIGYVIGRKRDVVEKLTARAPWLTWAAAALVAFSMVSSLAHWTPLYEPDRESLEYYFFGKSSLGLAPAPQFLALAFLATRLTHLVPRFLPPIWSWFSLLGRNSLVVFCAGTALSAIGQICHRLGYHGIVFDAGFAAGMLAILCGVAMTREWFKGAGHARPAARMAAGFSPADVGQPLPAIR